MITATEAGSILKNYYTRDTVRLLSYENNPTYAMLSKTNDEDVDGAQYVFPVQYGTGQGASASLPTAITNQSGNRYVQFQVQYLEQYQQITIADRLLKMARNGGAFFDEREREITGMLQTLTRQYCIQMFGNGGGSFGRISSGQGTVTITLTSIEQITNFEVGMVLQTASTDGTSGSVNTGTVTVTAVDRDAGTITTSAVWNVAIPSAAANDYIFPAGCFGVGISGFSAWVPDTAPGATSFNGVDRSPDPVRLGGCRVSGSSMSIRGGLRKLCARLGRESASPDFSVLSVNKYAALVDELDGKLVYVAMNASDADIGFEGIKLIGYGKGAIEVTQDQNCPDARGFVLTKGDWKLPRLGEIPNVWDDDGSVLCRDQTAAGWQVRGSWYANMGCFAPGHSGVLVF